MCVQIYILIDMNKTANLYARIEPDVKEQAESVLELQGFQPGLILAHMACVQGKMPLMGVER